MAKRRQCSNQFKLQALELFEQSGRQATEVARELAVRRNQLYKWQAELQSKGEERVFQGSCRPAAADEGSEVDALRREVAQLREKNAILKKSGGVLRARAAVKYAFIRSAQQTHQVAMLCRVQGVSRSGFYDC